MGDWVFQPLFGPAPRTRQQTVPVGVELPAQRPEALLEIGFDGYLRSDHAPQLATDESDAPEGYGMEGHIFAIGYLRGLDRASARFGGAR